MIRKKIHFVIDKTSKALAAKKILLKKYKSYYPKQSDAIVVVGGDGFMLEILKKYQKYNKPFYGLNRGTFGFLMNTYKTKKIDNVINNAKSVTITALEMLAVTKNNIKKKSIAINEVSLLRQSKQTASLQISIDKKVLIKNLLCDGVLVSTPAGSTAYNLSAKGPILSLDSKKLTITSISPFRPRGWIGKIVKSSSIIKIKNLNIKKRPVSVVADNKEARNVKYVKIRISRNIKFKLLYDKSNSLSKKIKLEKLKNK